MQISIRQRPPVRSAPPAEPVQSEITGTVLASKTLPVALDRNIDGAKKDPAQRITQIEYSVNGKKGVIAFSDVFFNMLPAKGNENRLFANPKIAQRQLQEAGLKISFDYSPGTTKVREITLGATQKGTFAIKYQSERQRKSSVNFTAE